MSKRLQKCPWLGAPPEMGPVGFAPIPLPDKSGSVPARGL
jgi:hypothetical protein